MKIKFNIFFLIIFVFNSEKVYSFADIETMCRGRIQGDTAYAQMGIDLRNRMFSKCKGDIEVCAKPYLKYISDVVERDKLAILELFNKENYDELTRQVMLQGIKSMNMSILSGFKRDEQTATKIALEQYDFCLKANRRK